MITAATISICHVIYQSPFLRMKFQLQMQFISLIIANYHASYM